jgi:hypothetical protein
MGRRADFVASLADLIEVTEAAAPRYTVRKLATDTWRLTPVATRRADYIAAATDEGSYGGAVNYIDAGESGSFDTDVYEDSYEALAGTVTVDGTPHNINAATPFNALEFRNVDAPFAALPSVAYLRLWPDTNDDPGLTIKAELSAAPDALSTTADDISNRSLTTAGTSWHAANVGVGAYRNTPDISAVLEEVFALGGWTRGSSDLVLVLSDAGTGGNLRYVSAEGPEGQWPVLHVEWATNGLVIQAGAADIIEYMADPMRRNIIGAAVADATSLAAATVSALSILAADTIGLTEALDYLIRLTIGDAAVLTDGVYSAYSASLTEPVKFSEAVARIAALRAASVDALKVSAAVPVKIGTAAGDELTLTSALVARRLFTAAISDTAWMTDASASGDVAELFAAIASDSIDLATFAASGWTGHPAAADALAFNATLAAVRQFVGIAADAGAIGDVAVFMKRGRAAALDAAGYADALRTLTRTRAGDTLALSDATLGTVYEVLIGLAADTLALSEGTSTAWQVNARDRLEFAASVANIMHWIEELSDTVGVTGLSAVFLPHGRLRVEFIVRGATVQFDISIPNYGWAE